ncbi:MAG: response regulator [Myxococcaceae bacterium]
MRRVLVVDDDRGSVEALCRLLTMDGFDAQGSSSGEEAVALLASQPFDAVVTDLEMPRVSGLRVVAAARKSRVVVVTAFAGSEACARAVALGAARIFEKPLSYEQLADELAEL